MADFFDKVLRSANKGINIIRETSAMNAANSGLERQIRELEDEKNKLITEAGKTAYRIYKDGGVTDEALIPYFGLAVQIEGKINALQTKIAEAANKNRQIQYGCVCASCGVENPEGAKFCRSCGAKIEPVKAQTASCPVCGQANRSGARFCTGCGGSLEKNQNAESIETEAKLCPVCGQENDYDAKFCSECGAEM